MYREVEVRLRRVTYDVLERDGGEGMCGGSSVGGGLSHNTVNRSLAKGRLQKKRKRKRREKTKQMD